VGRIILARVACINLAALGVTMLSPIEVPELWQGMFRLGLLSWKEEEHLSIEAVEPEAPKCQGLAWPRPQKLQQKSQNRNQNQNNTHYTGLDGYCLQCMRCKTLSGHGSFVLALTNLLGASQAKPPER
jgi:hypothetical protein